VVQYLLEMQFSSTKNHQGTVLERLVLQTINMT